MKRILCFFVSLLLLAGLLPAADAAPVEISWSITGRFGSNHTFILNREGTMTISGSGPMVGNEEYEFPWATALENEIYDFSNLVFRVEIRTGTTTVGANAFSPFSSLREVKLPQGIIVIGEEAFAGCAALERIDLPEGLTEIGESAFADCRKLRELSFPATLRSIGHSAFAGTALAEVKLPGGLVGLGGFAFHDTPWFSTQPDGMIYLNGYAYAYND